MESKENYNPIFGQYPVGKEFTYMGVLMRVTKIDHCKLPIGSTEDIIASYIHCDYITKDGYFDSKSFSVEEVASIAEEEEPLPAEVNIDINGRFDKMIKAQEERSESILRAIKGYDSKGES